MRSAYTRAVLCLGLLVGWASCQFHGGKPCSEDADCGSGGICDPSDRICHYIPAPAAVKWESPADNAWVGAQVPLVAVVEGVRADKLLAQLPYSIAPGDGGGVLFQDGGIYQGTWTSGDDGTYTLIAYLPSGLVDGGTAYSSPLRLRVDKTPPVLAVSVPAPVRPDGGTMTSYRDPAVGFEDAHHRDEIAAVVVSSPDDNVDPASIVVRVSGYKDGGTPAEVLSGLSPCDGGVHPFCRTVPLDLSKPELQAFRGTFLVEATGTDLAGNTADAVQVSVPVTRWKWSFDGGSSANIKATPAIGHEGTIYLGTIAGSAGNLYAVNADGVLRWNTSVGSVLASPAVGAWDGGSETVYVAGNTGDSMIYAINGADGGLIDSYTLASAATNGTMSLANVPPSAPVESAIAVINHDGSAMLLAFQPGGVPITLDSQPALNFPMGVVTNGTRFSWGLSNRLYNYGFDGGAWTTASPGPVPMSSDVHGLTLAANRLIGTIGTFGEGALFDVSVGDGGVLLYPTTPQQAWGLALARDSKVIYSDETPRLAKLDLSGQSSEVSTPIAKVIQTAPVVGADNMVYTVASNGTLNARTSDLALDWVWTLPGTVDSSPNLDCSRDSSGAKQPGRPGVLYVGSNNGHLYAIVVDSRGIDTQAAWPKYQHDPRNTGNSTTDLSEFTCP